MPLSAPVIIAPRPLISQLPDSSPPRRRGEDASPIHGRRSVAAEEETAHVRGAHEDLGDCSEGVIATSFVPVRKTRQRDAERGKRVFRSRNHA